MKWINNIKISTRLLVSFILVAIIAGAIGLMGIININKVNDLDSELYGKMTAPFNELIGITNDYQYMKIYVRETILVNDPVENEKNIAKFNERSTAFDKDLDVFNETLLTAAGKQLSEDLQSIKDSYVLIANQIITLAKANKNEEALTILHGEGAKFASEVDAKLQGINRC